MPKNEIALYGSVGESFWGEEHFTAATVRAALDGRSGPLTVRINSGGGLAWEGLAIYTMLRDYAATHGEVHTICDAAAHSSASLIFMAGDRRTMRLGATVMIHDPAMAFSTGRGTEHDHRQTADALGRIADAFAEVYAARIGLPAEQVREMMRAETWLDGEQAVALGVATDCDGLLAEVAAVFDYRLYARAPEGLRMASESLGHDRGHLARLAMMAAPQTQLKGPNMERASEERAEEVVSEAETEAVGAPPAPADEPNVDTAVQAATMAERTRHKNIRAMVMLAGFPAAEAEMLTADLIDRGVSTDAAVNIILAKRKETEMSEPLAHGPRVQIVRDERETRRAAMRDALAAQMTGRKPETDAARPYMTMSLAEMAAATLDWKAPLRTAGDRIEVFMAAGHSRSDFVGIFESALNKSLLERYTTAEPTFRQISRVKRFNDFRVHPMVRAGDYPMLQPLGEGGEIKFGTFGEKRETAVLSSYAIGVGVSRQMMVDDDLGAINDLLGSYGDMIADFEEQTFYSFMASAVLASDNTPVWHASHNNLAGTGGAINETTLAAGKAAMRKQTTIDGRKMNLSPAILLVGPDKEVEALKMVAGITPATAANVNVFSGSMRVIVSAQITGNAWYLFAEPSGQGACFVHGYLNGAEAPRVRIDEPFGHQGVKVTIEHDFGLGAIDFRGTYRNPGA